MRGRRGLFLVYFEVTHYITRRTATTSSESYLTTPQQLADADASSSLVPAIAFPSTPHSYSSALTFPSSAPYVRACLK